MASAAALAYLPASGDDSWAWALLGLTPLQALELLVPCLLICWLMCEALFYVVMLLVHRRLDVLTLPERYVDWRESRLENCLPFSFPKSTKHGMDSPLEVNHDAFLSLLSRIFLPLPTHDSSFPHSEQKPTRP